MLALLDQTHEPFVADAAEALIARTAADRLKAVAAANVDIKITVDSKEDDKVIVPLPARAVSLFLYVLETMAKGTPMSLIPHEAELTTQQAADYLNVSRPFLIRQMEQEKLPYRKVGTHRRIRFADLYAFERDSRQNQVEALTELNAEARRLNLE